MLLSFPKQCVVFTPDKGTVINWLCAGRWGPQMQNARERDVNWKNTKQNKTQLYCWEKKQKWYKTKLEKY